MQSAVYYPLLVRMVIRMVCPLTSDIVKKMGKSIFMGLRKVTRLLQLRLVIK